MNLFQQRFWLIIIVILISSVLTISRLLDVQIIRGSEYAALADANSTFKLRTPRQRGVILDRYGQPLVENYPIFYQVTDPDQVYTAKKMVNADLALSLMATAEGSVATEIRRVYPLAEVMAPVLGYTGIVSTEDLELDPDLKSGEMVGKHGLERELDRSVRGQSGTEIYEVDALGKKRQLIDQQLGKVGENIATTIDPYLSQVAYQAMGDRTGAVVISDPETGAILSLISTPSFDPNVLTAKYTDQSLEKFRQQTVNYLFADERQLFFNRAVSGSYPPGSVFKIVSAAAGLSSGKVDASTSVIDEGVLEVGDYSYANWYYSQYGGKEGEIALQRAIARSNDIYFYKVAEWVGPNTLANMAREFGFGSPAGIELNNEAAGLVPDLDWKEQVLGEKWYLGNTYHFGIGQGNLLVTPLQVSQMIGVMANHGSKCMPHLISTDQLNCSGLPLAEENIDLIMAGMLDACSTGGTAYPFFSWNEQYRNNDQSSFEQLRAGAVACKTGTAEFGSSDERGYKKTHGWFVMAIGMDQLLEQVLSEDSEENVGGDNHQAWLDQIREYGLPNKLTITVLVESDDTEPFREGSRDAAPVAKEILDWMVRGDKVEAIVAEPNEGEIGE